jgi:hypothetical protein
MTRSSAPRERSKIIDIVRSVGFLVLVSFPVKNSSPGSFMSDWCA